MKEFLMKLMELLSLQDAYDIENRDKKTIEELQYIYQNWDLSQKNQLFEIVRRGFSSQPEELIMILSALIVVTKEEEAVFRLEDLLVHTEMNCWNRLFYYHQLGYSVFRNGIQCEQYLEYRNLRMIKGKILTEMRALIGKKYEYTAFNQRNKQVVLVTDTILTNRHAPTKIVANIYKALIQLGYEVTLYVVHFPGTGEGTDICGWYGHRISACKYTKTGSFQQEINGTVLKGICLKMESRNMISLLSQALDTIYKDRPEFVWGIGSFTMMFLQDLCRAFTTVVSMSCIMKPSVSEADIIARYFNYSDEEDALFRKGLWDNQTVYDFKYKGDVQTEKALTKEELGIPQDSFLISIVGNRLESEILGGGGEHVIEEIMQLDERIHLVFIGPYNIGREFLKPYENRVRYLGARKDFCAAVGVADLFFNPPRQGGGTGALYSVFQGVPVVTLSGCDVAGCVGQEFTCGSIQEMPGLVKRYLYDEAFMKRQQLRCREFTGHYRNHSDLAEVEKLCLFVKEHTLVQEEKAVEER